MIEECEVGDFEEQLVWGFINGLNLSFNPKVVRSLMGGDFDHAKDSGRIFWLSHTTSTPHRFQNTQ